MSGVISNAILRTQSDERLVSLSRAGHKRAFEAIVERYRPELGRALRRILPPATVDDALQQTHLQAWQALSSGTEVRELRPWLHRIARNAAIAASSRGYDYDELKDALAVSPGPYEDLERREAVRRALWGIAALPERQREALLAVAVEGRSHSEVAVELGITDTAARQLVRRARVSLLAMMSVATPPQLVRWAVRAGRSGLGPGKATAGKAAAGKAAAGTGLGGTVGGSALKVGVIAITVGGVAAGVPPIRHALVPPTAPRTAHHRRARARPPAVFVTAALKTPSGPGLPASGASGTAYAGRRRGHHDVRAAELPVTYAVSSSPAAASTPAVVPVTTGVTPAAVSSTGGGASTSAAQAAGALTAWWLADHPQRTSGETHATRPTGVSHAPAGSPGGSSSVGDSESAGSATGSPVSCGAPDPASDTPTGTVSPSGTQQSQAGSTAVAGPDASSAAASEHSGGQVGSTQDQSDPPASVSSSSQSVGVRSPAQGSWRDGGRGPGCGAPGSEPAGASSSGTDQPKTG
jgi:RNA polymerase sigma factor (sigma-70 family)